MSDIDYKRRKDDGRKRIIQFDPTFHAGHVATIFTIIFCTIGAWYDMKSSVATLKEENVRQEQRIAKAEEQSQIHYDKVQRDISEINKANRDELAKLRDDMNNWFIRLSDKIEKKADKNGK